MKKLGSFVAVFFWCVFVSLASTYAANVTAPQVKGLNFETYYILGETIPTSSYIEKTIYGMSSWDSVSSLVISTSSGSIPTASITWKIPSAGSLVTARADLMRTDGSRYRLMPTDVATIRFNSGVAATVHVTANIMLRKDSGMPMTHKQNLALSVPTASTTFLVTPATQGFWLLRSPGKVYIDLDNGTATSADFYLNAGDVFTTNYLKSGDSIKMLSDSGTIVVTGEVFE